LRTLSASGNALTRRRGHSYSPALFPIGTVFQPKDAFARVFFLDDHATAAPPRHRVL